MTLSEGPRLRNVKTKASSLSTGGTTSTGVQSTVEAEEEEPVSPTGRLFLDDGFYTIILCALEFQQRMELDHLRTVLKETLVHHPRFHSRVEYGGKGRKASAGRWVPMDVNMHQHVVEAQLNEAELAQPETAMESFMGRLVSFPRMDPSRPLWDAHLFHVTRSNSASVCVFRIHHALGDGTSLMSLLLACTRQTHNPTFLPTLPGSNLPPQSAPLSTTTIASTAAPPSLPAPHMPSEDSSETLDSMAASEGNLSQTPFARAAKKGAKGSFLGSIRKGAVVAWNTLQHISHFLAVVTVLPDTRTVIKAGKGLHSSPKAVAVTPPFSLLDVSTIRKAVGATVNDVMMALLALAMERYLERRQEASKDGSKLPKRCRVTAVGLVNLRKSPGLKELSIMMEDTGSGSKSKRRAPWGNYMGTYLLPLPVAPFSSQQEGFSSTSKKTEESTSSNTTGDSCHVVDTLMQVKRMCDSKKLSLEAHWTYLNGEIVMSLAGAKGAALVLGRLTSQTTMSVSNMLGPVEQVSLGGIPVTAIVPTVPPPNHALCCHFQSYNGELRVVLYAALENFPDPQELCHCFVEAFGDLKAAVC